MRARKDHAIVLDDLPQPRDLLAELRDQVRIRVAVDDRSVLDVPRSVCVVCVCVRANVCVNVCRCVCVHA